MIKCLYILVATISVAVLGGCAYVPVQEMETSDVILFKELADTQGTALAPADVTENFEISDPVVNVLVTVKWPATESEGGIKDIRWEWYTGEELVSVVESRFNFYATPFTILGHIPTRSLGVGTHQVKLFIEDVQFADEQFRVSEE